MSRDQYGGGPILGRGTKLIGSLIGAGTEAYAHRKAKKEEANAQKTQAPAVEHDEQSDNEDWALDDASGELLSAQKTPESQPTLSLLDMPGISTPTTPMRPLPCPVILPQRRPQTKSRGFVRAYAPLLGQCKGPAMDEKMFLKFLDEFADKSQANPYLQAFNVAAGFIGMVPSVVAMAVSMTLTAGSNAAIEAQTRYKANSYLDQANAKYFNPHNLHCVIMTFKPSSSERFVNVDMNTTNDALMKSINKESKLGKMKTSSGTAKSEFAIPDSAPLVYPALDKAAFAVSEHGKPLPAEKQNALQRSSVFIKAYIDRRAQAEYTGVHGEDSKLSSPGATDPQKFASRYADPNHPANSGSILALLTGGAVDPRAKLLNKRADLHAKVSGQALTEQDRKNIAMGRGGPTARPGLINTVRKVIQEDVLYLLIAEIPSPQEMAEYARMNQ